MPPLYFWEWWRYIYYLFMFEFLNNEHLKMLIIGWLERMEINCVMRRCWTNGKSYQREKSYMMSAWPNLIRFKISLYWFFVFLFLSLARSIYQKTLIVFVLMLYFRSIIEIYVVQKLDMCSLNECLVSLIKAWTFQSSNVVHFLIYNCFFLIPLAILLNNFIGKNFWSCLMFDYCVGPQHNIDRQ